MNPVEMFTILPKLIAGFWVGRKGGTEGREKEG